MKLHEETLPLDVSKYKKKWCLFIIVFQCKSLILSYLNDMYHTRIETIYTVHGLLIISLKVIKHLMHCIQFILLTKLKKKKIP